MPQNAFFPRKSQSSGQPKIDAKTLFSHPPSPFPRIFLQLQQWWHLYCFTILGLIFIVMHSMKQCLLRNRPWSDAVTSCAKDYEGHSLLQTSFTEPPNTYIWCWQSFKFSLPLAWCECISLRELCSCFIYSDEMFPATFPSALVCLSV